jgi:bacterioferritin-associated ferredoxin
MIVCSCNVFSDHDVRATLKAPEVAPRTTGQVYHCLGCSAQCGRCARTIRRIMNEALDGAATACCQDKRHDGKHQDAEHLDAERHDAERS